MGRKGFLLIGFLLSMLLVWIFHCEAVTDVSSTQTIPIKEKPHNLGHRGKAHSNAPSPELVLCPQLKFLPMSAPTIPVVQKTLPSAPASAPSRHISLEHKHSRFISPSIEFLSSHSPTDEVTDVSPTQTIPSVHPPIAESSHNLGHHGKALSNVPSPALVLRPQLKFPPMSAPTNSFFQKTLPSAPTSAPSPRIRVQHMHSRLISSSIEFLSPHTPIGEVTDISPTQTIPSAHPPTTENSHYLGHRGNAHSNAPSPARTNPFVQKTLPFVPGASSRRIRVEHQHLRLISPSLEFLSPHIPFGEVTDVSPAQTIPFAHPPIAESSHNLGHRGKAHSNAPSSVALHPQLKFPPMSGPTNPFVQKSLPSAPASAPSRRISVENNHSSPISPFIEFLSPQTPIGEVTDVSPTQTIPFAHPPIAESSHNLGHHGKALSNAPSLAPTNPFVQNTAPFAPTFAPYSRISVEHKHLRRISPSLEFLSPHTPSGEVTDISPTQTIPSAHPPTTENSHNLGHCGKAHNNAPSRVTDVSPAQTIPFAHPPIAESSHNLGHCGKAHSNAPSSVALHPQLKFPLMSAPTNPFVQKSLPSAPASAPSHRISVENNHLRPISPFIKFLSPQTPIGKVTDVSPTQTIPSAHPPIAESFHNLGHHGKALSNAPSPAPTNPFVQKTAPFVPTFAPSRRISVEHKHSRRISPSIEFLSPHTPSGEVTDISPTQTIPSAHPPTTENSHNLGHRGKAHSNAPSPVTDVSPTQTISFVHPPIAESSHNVGHHGKALSHAPSPAPANPVVQKPLPFAAASAPSRCISVEHKHLRLISPSIECLSPHTPTGEGTDVSPSQPIPSVLPPVGESVHNSRYHGKAHNDAPTPRIGISPSQPITHVLPPIEESLHNPRSHGKTHNNAPTPGTDLSPLLPIPSVLTPIGESFHNPGYHGTHNNAPILGHIVIPSNMNSSIPPHIAKLIPAGGYLGKSPISDAPKAMLVSKGLVSFPSNLSPSMPPHIAKRIPGGGHHRNATFGNAPKAIPVSKEPVSSPPSVSPLKPPSRQSIVNAIAPSMTSCFSHGINKKGPVASPIWISPSITHWKRHGIHVAAPPREIITHSSPANHPPAKALSPVITPTHEQVRRASNVASPQPNVFPKIHERKRVGPPVAAPSNFFQRPHVRKRVRSPASAPSHLSPPYRASLTSPAPAHNLELGRASRVPTASPRRHWKLGPSSPTESPFPFTVNQLAPASFPSIVFPSSPVQGSIYPPKVSPSVSLPTMPSVPVSSPVRALPPPPPNQDCMAVTCPDPLTNTPPGSPCGCVLPLQVGLRLSVALYTFFPLVSELAQEMAAGIFMKQSQVRIMGANAASQQPEKTIVLIDLVPLGEKFDNTTAFLTYEKFWHKQVIIDNAFFGDYEVLYVRYPGLPPSPPSAPMNITLNDGPFIPDSNSRKMDPLGVDVRKQKNRLGGSLIAVIILSSAVVLLIFVGSAWFLLTRHEAQPHGPEPVPLNFASPFAKPSGVGSMISGSGPSSTSLSFASSIAMYMGSARTFSSAEIEKATDGFDPAKILGEGGFGRVYRGVLEDSMKVAVKVLKRDDQQGGREFLAEIEMLSRLHHRNLVKLIGICTEEHSRCLVYELIPNGSLESHLHGVDKERSPLDWGARVKIALGSARGLAYLHEDSSPRVIHRDFKSSNILLEDDFTPKVSDFGLARTALEEGNQHILTRVMGTFGYVAPEYAMTGHLLVKSDVYSYGVVLLELLTGRKPVDMSQPHGQENLVTWARPLLTSKEGLKIIIDPALADDFSFDSVAKVAAIASMCAQSDVSHRPFMGEVVQALKLVCDDTDEKNGGSDSCSKEELSAQDIEVKISSGSGQFPRTHSSRATDYDSGLEAERALSTSDLFSISARFVRQVSGSFRRHSSLGPLRSGRSHQRFWQRVKGLPRGSVSEHGLPSNCGQV